MAEYANTHYTAKKKKKTHQTKASIEPWITNAQMRRQVSRPTGLAAIKVAVKPTKTTMPGEPRHTLWNNYFTVLNIT